MCKILNGTLVRYFHCFCTINCFRRVLNYKHFWFIYYEQIYFTLNGTFNAQMRYISFSLHKLKIKSESSFYGLILMNTIMQLQYGVCRCFYSLCATPLKLVNKRKKKKNVSHYRCGPNKAGFLFLIVKGSKTYIHIVRFQTKVGHRYSAKVHTWDK